MSACPGTHTCVRRHPERAASSASCWRRGGVGRVHVYLHLRAELLQLARGAARYVAVRGPGSRLALSGRLEIPSRGGARQGDGDALALAAELGCMATCQVWRLATVPFACAGCVASVAMAPLARSRSFCVPPGPMSWASRAQADLVGRFPLAGVRVTPTRRWTDPGSAEAFGGAVANRCRRGRPALAMEATPVVIQCFWKVYHAPCPGPGLGLVRASCMALACS